MLTMDIRVGGGGQGGSSPASPKLGRNPFHSVKFSERTIGNSGNFLPAPQLYLLFRAENLQPP